MSLVLDPRKSEQAALNRILVIYFNDKTWIIVVSIHWLLVRRYGIRSTFPMTVTTGIRMVMP